jgi:hypothetical protein
MYRGELDHKGQRHGRGATYRGEDTSLVYEGDWMENKKHGYGQLYNSDATLRYIGTWYQDTYAHGTLFHQKETTWYSGDFRDGARHGMGVSYHLPPSPNVPSYKGEWEYGKRHGQGTSFAVDGTVTYKGEWKCGRMHGVGSYEGAEGVYRGDFFNDLFHGHGVWTVCGRTYEGDVVEGKRHGFGREWVHTSDGKVLVYQGGWRENERDTAPR